MNKTINNVQIIITCKSLLKYHYLFILITLEKCFTKQGGRATFVFFNSFFIICSILFYSKLFEPTLIHEKNIH